MDAGSSDMSRSPDIDISGTPRITWDHTSYTSPPSELSSWAWGWTGSSESTWARRWYENDWNYREYWSKNAVKRQGYDEVWNTEGFVWSTHTSESEELVGDPTSAACGSLHAIDTPEVRSGAITQHASPPSLRDSVMEQMRVEAGFLGSWSAGTISQQTLTWNNGSTSMLQINLCSIKLTWGHQYYQGTLLDDEIHWDDGDVWTRLNSADSPRLPLQYPQSSHHHLAQISKKQDDMDITSTTAPVELGSNRWGVFLYDEEDYGRCLANNLYTLHRTTNVGNVAYVMPPVLLGPAPISDSELFCTIPGDYEGIGYDIPTLPSCVLP